MHDQNSIDTEETSAQKYQRALDLFTESVLKPDHDLRGCAYNQGCYDELMEIWEDVLESLKTLKEASFCKNYFFSFGLNFFYNTNIIFKWKLHFN